MADFSISHSLSSHTSDEDEEHQPENGENERTPQTPPFPTEPNPINLSNPTPAVRPPRRSSRTPTAAVLSPPQQHSTGSGRKPRGRPPGSKNKPKPPIYITKEMEPSIKTQQLEIPAGCDIVDMVQRFSRKRRVGVHIFSGSGSVSNFTLRHPAVTLSGAFNLLSLSGTFMGPSVCSSSSSCSKERASSSFSSGGSSPWLAIFVGGSAGEVFGGMVVGKVLAASDVVLNVNTFANYEYHRVEPAEFEDDEEEVGSRGGPAVKQEGCSVSAGGGSGSMTPVGFAVPADHLNWAPLAPTSRPMNHHF